MKASARCAIFICSRFLPGVLGVGLRFGLMSAFGLVSCYTRVILGSGKIYGYKIGLG